MWRKLARIISPGGPTQINLVGGLGNQLFGFIAGKYLEEIHGHKVVFNTWHIPRGLTDHGVSIERRGLTGRFVSKPPPSRWLRRFITPYRSPELGWDPALARIYKGQVVEGYFQSWKFLTALRNFSISAEDILLHGGKSLWLEEKLEEAKSEGPVVIHFRRGDYKRVSDAMGLLGRDYYEKALQIVRAETPASPVWIFSDEPDLAKHFFSGMSAHFSVIDPPVDSDPGESLFLMSYGCGHLISNSTFAWWGAMLSPSSKFVVAPTPWLKGSNSPRDLYPEGWTLIGHDWDSN